jgi:hypothetical protein
MKRHRTTRRRIVTIQISHEGLVSKHIILIIQYLGYINLKVTWLEHTPYKISTKKPTKPLKDGEHH